MQALKEHYNPKPSPVIQRYEFNTGDRRSGESIATYVVELRALGEHCGFKGTLNKMIQDRFGMRGSVNNHNIQRHLLQEAEFTYRTAYDLDTTMEAAAKDSQDLRCPACTMQVQQVQG